ncbi:basic salivary proline-rich protein 1-like [Candoia aspera]|uniref:basic salivary proline-rich protein 1-like n=1 Tax=Candoia aspera TaxID=51853 RepID=UPI002FD83216
MAEPRGRRRSFRYRGREEGGRDGGRPPRQPGGRPLGPPPRRGSPRGMGEEACWAGGSLASAGRPPSSGNCNSQNSQLPPPLRAPQRWELPLPECLSQPRWLRHSGSDSSQLPGEANRGAASQALFSAFGIGRSRGSRPLAQPARWRGGAGQGRAGQSPPRGRGQRTRSHILACADRGVSADSPPFSLQVAATAARSEETQVQVPPPPGKRAGPGARSPPGLPRRAVVSIKGRRGGKRVEPLPKRHVSRPQPSRSFSATWLALRPSPGAPGPTPALGQQAMMV